MGEDVRLQNELQTHPPLYVDGYLRKGQGTVDEFRIQMEEKYRHAVEELSRRVEEHPNLSRRYRYYMESFVLTGLGCSMITWTLSGRKFGSVLPNPIHFARLSAR